jgi:alanyl-tRNA synthetase
MSVPRTSDEIRQAFLDFFNEMGHEVVPSSSLVPAGNTTLLFTNAGMNQFTDALLGLEKRPNPRATSAQKVMRVSGKHNDLENVGPSDRHQTFFEMLGNFSFGNYFKKEAIEYAWMFVTAVLKLEPEKLWVTVYTDDDEAAGYWAKHIAPERVLRFGAAENFWTMGETGPCGPNSEIFYYTGPIDPFTQPERALEDGRQGVNVSDDYNEIWNLVFMQYDRAADGTLTPLPFQSIDTGMGLERVSRAVQGVNSNYDTDLFVPILNRIQALLGDTDEQRAEKWIGYRVIADHARSATFLIGDGVVPGNEGRSYVLRLILRRALRYGKMIGFTGPFIAEVARAVIEKMGHHYTELREQESFILEALRREEASFQRTLDRGIALLDELMSELRGRGESVVPGEQVFRLYDTFGFPYDLTRDIAEENGFTIDRDGFDHAMAAQRARARASGTFNVDAWAEHYRRLADDLPQTAFLGYDYAALAQVPVQVVAIVDPESGQLLNEAATGSEVELLLDRSPFYAEGGGQVGDTGVIETEYGRALVQEVQKPVPGVWAHRVTVVSGTIRRGEMARATVDAERRWDIMRNHTATHLLHRALRDTLGEHAQQRGSLVAPDYLRFDFNHLQKVTDEELETIERTVNRYIREDLEVMAEEMAISEAQERGATMLFGEKYGDTVRVVSLCGAGNGADPSRYSQELCGGTHLLRTGQIGSLLIAGEQSVSQGVRRITAITGRAAEEAVRQQRQALRSLARKVGAQPDQLETRIEQLQQELADRDRQLQAIQRDLSRRQLDTLLSQVQEVDGVKVLAAQVEATSAENLREMSDWLRDRLGNAIVVLGAAVDEKPLLVAAATEDAVKRGGHAGNLVREVARVVGGGGGGRPNLAQAGGRDVDKLPEALAKVSDLVREQLN